MTSRRSFLAKIFSSAIAAPAVAGIIERGSITKADPMGDEWRLYHDFAAWRKKHAHLLAGDERFLDPSDKIQSGDFYFGHAPEKWLFNGPKGARVANGSRVPDCFWCYAPAGKDRRSYFK